MKHLISSKAGKYRRRKDVYVDIDGTLIVDGELNTGLVTWIKNKNNRGFSVFAWSARGREYTKKVLRYHAVLGLFVEALPKPSYIVDDMGHKWDTHITTIKPSMVDGRS